MKKFVFFLNLTVIVTLFILLFSAGTYADCTKDIDCKGERVCEKGICVEPGQKESSQQHNQTNNNVHKKIKAGKTPESPAVSKDNDQSIEQKKALFKALEKVNASANRDYRKYSESLSDAEVEFNVYQHLPYTDTFNCFVVLQACLFSYKEVALYWELAIYSCDDYTSSSDLCKSKRQDRDERLREANENLDKAYKECFPKNGPGQEVVKHEQDEAMGPGQGWRAVRDGQGLKSYKKMEVDKKLLLNN